MGRAQTLLRVERLDRYLRVVEAGGAGETTIGGARREGWVRGRQEGRAGRVGTEGDWRGKAGEAARSGPSLSSRDRHLLARGHAARAHDRRERTGGDRPNCAVAMGHQSIRNRRLGLAARHGTCLAVRGLRRRLASRGLRHRLASRGLRRRFASRLPLSLLAPRLPLCWLGLARRFGRRRCSRPRRGRGGPRRFLLR